MARIGFLLLSGGKSSRMGTPKALLEINGETLLEAVARAGEGFEERILSVNDPSIPTLEGFVRVSDIYPGCGPMSGLHAALEETDCDALVTAPCDTPHYSKALAEYLAQQYDPSFDAWVLEDASGRVHPLCGMYSKRCLAEMEEHLKSGRFKLMRMLEHVSLKTMKLPPHLSDQVFDNLNTPEDLAVFSKHI